jgi:peroxiredoxin
MRMQEIGRCVGFAALAVVSLMAAAPVPRPSPGLAITNATGQQIQISSLKGKVVAVEFLLTRCPHCWRLAQTLDKLHKELGARGFEVTGVAFDNGISGPVAAQFAAASRIGFPVGFVTADKVDAYLGREGNERFQVPQIVVIDRSGVVRAQSRAKGEISLENESYLRNLIDALLKERAP